jgi:multicomponent Na+:H+ antiporter subunit G
MLDVLAVILVTIGLLFFLGASIGLLRFPGFYTRMHAAGKGDTLSTVLILLGCAIFSLAQAHFTLAAVLVAVKILLIAGFIFLGSPTATHAILDAGYETEVEHWKRKDKK